MSYVNITLAWLFSLFLAMNIGLESKGGMMLFFFMFGISFTCVIRILSAYKNEKDDFQVATCKKCKKAYWIETGTEVECNCHDT